MTNIEPERFWSVVSQGDSDACWEWRGNRLLAGYGVVQLDGSRHALAHRVVWELTYGPIPTFSQGREPFVHQFTMLVCHRCDNPPCVNPAHLFLGTYDDNVQDARRKGRLHGSVALSRAAAKEIRQRYDAGVAPSLIAEAFGVTRRTVHNIGKRRTWFYLDGHY